MLFHMNAPACISIRQTRIFPSASSSLMQGTTCQAEDSSQAHPGQPGGGRPPRTGGSGHGQGLGACAGGPGAPGAPPAERSSAPPPGCLPDPGPECAMLHHGPPSATQPSLLGLGGGLWEQSAWRCRCSLTTALLVQHADSSMALLSHVKGGCVSVWKIVMEEGGGRRGSRCGRRLSWMPC